MKLARRVRVEHSRDVQLTVKVGRLAADDVTLSAALSTAELTDEAASSASARTRAAQPRAKRGAVTRIVLHLSDVTQGTRREVVLSTARGRRGWGGGGKEGRWIFEVQDGKRQWMQMRMRWLLRVRTVGGNVSKLALAGKGPIGQALDVSAGDRQGCFGGICYIPYHAMMNALSCVFTRASRITTDAVSLCSHINPFPFDLEHGCDVANASTLMQGHFIHRSHKPRRYGSISTEKWIDGMRADC